MKTYWFTLGDLTDGPSISARVMAKDKDSAKVTLKKAVEELEVEGAPDGVIQARLDREVGLWYRMPHDAIEDEDCWECDEED